MSRTGVVRPIEPTDVAGFRGALDEVAKEKRFLLFEEAPSIERLSTFVENNINSGNPHIVALIDGEIVGWCDIVRETGRPTRSHCGTLGMGVLSGHRGKGLGKRLLQQALTAAMVAGIRRVELTVRASNDRAIELYLALGFVHEGHQRKAVMVDGAYEDRHLMAYLAPELAETTA